MITQDTGYSLPVFVSPRGRTAPWQAGLRFALRANCALATTITVFLAVSAGICMANQCNYRQYVVGARAAGMGGAACANVNSVDACYYNPAGLSRIRRDSMSVSANLYGFQRYSAEDALYPGDDLSTDTFASIPSAMGTVTRLSEDTVLAVGGFVPAMVSISEIESFLNLRHFYNISIDDQTLWVGPAIAHSFSDRLSLGMSVFGVYRTYSYMESIFLGDYPLSYSKNLKYKNLGLLSLLGAQYRLDERWSLGLMFQSPSMNLDFMNDGEYEAHQVWRDDTGYYEELYYADDMHSNNKIPAKIVMGVSVEEKRKYALSADVIYHFPTSYTLVDGELADGGPATIMMRYESVLDFAIGAEYYTFDNYPVRLGFYTSMSAAPDVDPENRDYPGKIDLYGITASVGKESDRIAMQVGINYAFGDGEDHGWVATDDGLDVKNVRGSEEHLYFFFNTTYMF